MKQRIRIYLACTLALSLFLTFQAHGQSIEPVSSLPNEPGLLSSSAGKGALKSAAMLLSDPASADVLAGEQALSEVSIDVNPTNRDNQVIVGHAGNFQTMNTFYTMDGGLTWNFVPLGNTADGLTSTFRFDPTLAFDDDGNVYVGYGVRTPVPSPGTGNQVTVVVCKSTDGGQTYPQCVQLDTNPNIGTLPGNDKWHLATGPDPTVASQQNVYIAWTKNVTEASGTDQRIVVSSSTDGGVTWSAPLTINDPSISGTQAGNLFADPAVGPNGELYVAWHDIGAGQIYVDASTDGGSTFGTDVLVASSSTGFKTSIPAQPDRGVHVGPTIDADRSGGTFDGRLYLTYTDVGAGGLPDVNIIVLSSDDGGASWSSAVQVNDDGGTNSQFLPWLDVDQQTGLVSVVWYDARNDVNNKKVEVFLGVSEDGGATFQPNILVSDAMSDMSVDNASRYTGNFLEYIGVASLNGIAFPVWADNNESPGDLDYYTDQIPIGNPPVADAGSDQTVECTGPAGATVTLDGSGSSDPDGDPLTYTWSEGATVIAGPTAAPTVDVMLSLGTHIITLEVDDGNLLTDTDEVIVTIVDTTPPVITLIGDAVITLECSVDTYVEPGATVTDTCDENPSLVIDDSAVDPTTPGDYTVFYTATDANGNIAVMTRTVEVRDTNPPEITVNAEPTTFWPPDHKYDTIDLENLDIEATDLCDANVSEADVVIASVSSDEPEDAKGGGDGKTLDDIVIDCRTVDLRAERQGGGNGRVYTLHVHVDDASDNVGTASYQVHVPQDIEVSPFGIDDGPAYTETGCDLTSAPLASVLAAEDGPPEKLSDAQFVAEEAPIEYRLGQNYPNPFNPVTTLAFDLPEAGEVRLMVYDVLGRQVRVLVEGVLPSGRHQAQFEAGDLPSGLYLVRLETAQGTFTRRMILAK